MKQSAYLKKIQKIQAHDLAETAETSFRIGAVAATFAANDILQLGEGRAEAFIKAYENYVVEINKIVLQDFRTDKELVYSMTKINQRLKEITGTYNFQL